MLCTVTRIIPFFSIWVMCYLLFPFSAFAGTNCFNNKLSLDELLHLDQQQLNQKYCGAKKFHNLYLKRGKIDSDSICSKTINLINKVLKEEYDSAPTGCDDFYQSSIASRMRESKKRSVVKLYDLNCKTCHAAGIAGAPRTGDLAVWQVRLGKGLDNLLNTVRNGLNAMPAKGMCYDCSDDEYKALINYMSTTSMD